MAKPVRIPEVCHLGGEVRPMGTAKRRVASEDCGVEMLKSVHKSQCALS